MNSFIGTFLLGVICIIIGILNSRGDISTIHSYHRKRVSETDRIPFGKKVGLGMIIIGVSMIVYSGLSLISEFLGNNIFTVIGVIVLIIGIAIGLGLCFYAMIKYNKGIF